MTNKDELTKENARVKQVLKENGYQESIISKTCKRITNSHSLHQSHQQTRATDIQEKEMRTSIYLSYVEGTSEKLWHILRSNKARYTLHKLFCKPKDAIAAEDENNFADEIGFSNRKAVYFGETVCL